MPGRWVVALALLGTLAAALPGCGRGGAESSDTRSAAGPATSTEVARFLREWAEPVGDVKDATTGYPKRIRRTKDGGEMVLIPAGTFQMGAVPGDGHASDNEKPRHAVEITKPYYMDEHEVTGGQWKRFVSGSGGRMPDNLRTETTDAHPIHEVDWNEADAFARWVGASLPTEAQWERAAKGGHDDYVYPWGASDDVKRRNGWGAGDGFTGLAPCMSFATNDFGLYDMSGNVREMCADPYGVAFYAVSPPRDPSGPASGTVRVVRGGSWGNLDVGLRVSDRFPYPSAYRSYFLGFRLARSLP